MTEGRISDEIRLVLSECGVIAWRNNCGVAEQGGRTIRFGVGSPGGADLIGLYRGRFLAIEVKTPTGRLSDEQKRFQQLVDRNGGWYVVLRSAAEARRWCATLPDLTR